jgi:FixJ family two-component response regulator
MTLKKQPLTRVFVVDASESDYDLLQSDEGDREVRTFPSGRDALRCNPEETPTMWLINLRLPDMSGTTLHDMLRGRGCRGPIGLVGDSYCVEDEITARMAGASFYLAKPVPAEMIASTVAG